MKRIFLALPILFALHVATNAQTSLPANFFSTSAFNTNFPLGGGIVVGTLGKVGGIVGGWLEPTCDGGTNQASSCYLWGSLDSYVAKAQSNGLTIVYDFSIPGWMCGNPGLGNGCTTLPSNLVPLTNFATTLATRYRGKIRYYETGNEVNVSTTWTDTCANLVLAHNTIYAAIKAGDPTAVVGAPNMAAFNGSIGGGGACVSSPVAAGNVASVWLSNFLQTQDSNGHKPTADTVGVHTYAAQPPLSQDGCDWVNNKLHCAAAPLLHLYNSFRAVMNSNGMTSVPLLVTEGGFNVDDSSAAGPYGCSANLNNLTACLSNAQQVAYISRWLVLSASTWADGNGQLPNWYSYDINWGTLNGTNGMNPQNSTAFGQTEGWIRGAAFTQQCQPSTTLFICDYTTTGGVRKEIVFNDNNGSTTSYTTPSWAATFTPLLGTASPISGGTVTVGDAPVFLAPIVPTCHVITPAGSGTKSGADWSNAIAGFPWPTNFIRGDVYYISDGQYGGFNDFNEAMDAGHNLITIKKAIPADHCTDTGWNPGTMGSGQAQMGPLTNWGTTSCRNFGFAQSANTGDIVIDGQIGTGQVKGSYGIFLPLSQTSSDCQNGPYNIFIGAGSNTSTNITIRYVEAAGSCGGVPENSSYKANCNAITDLPKQESNIRVNNVTNLLVEHTFVHNSASTPYEIVHGNNGLTFQYNQVHFDNYTGANHSSISALHSGNSNVTLRYNVFLDTEGTAGHVSLNNIPLTGTDSNVAIYGNVFSWTQGFPYGVGGYGDGIVACINGNSCPNWVVYNNTIVNAPFVGGTGETGVLFNAGNCTGGAAAQVRNNLWYSNQGTISFSVCAGGVESNNSFLNSGGPWGGGSNDVNNTSSPNPFVNWPGGNFNLVSDSSNWNNGVTLSAPYNVDPVGTIRGSSGTWDRGAYQLISSNAPSAPTNLLATVSGSTVNASWTASTGSPVPTAYTFYRGSVHGGPYNVVKSGLTGTSTTDNPPNGTWFYVVTAYVGGIVSSVSGNGSVATVTCTAACSFPSGTTFVLGGNSVAAFNGTFSSTSQPTSNTFTFASSTNGTGSGGGAWQPTSESAKSNEVQVTVPAALTATLAPLSFAFASTVVGSNSPTNGFTLTNTSGAGGTITISSISFTGANAGDFSQTNNCPSLLMSGLSCTITGTFTPTASGARSATLSVIDNATGSPQTSAVSGTGVSATPTVSLNPTSLNFGDQTVGVTSVSRGITLTNTGSGTLSISSIVANGDFAQGNTCGASVAPLASCAINVTFTPSVSGIRTGSITITDNAAGSPHVVNLTGNGTTTKCQLTGNVTLSGQSAVCGP